MILFKSCWRNLMKYKPKNLISNYIVGCGTAMLQYLFH